MNPGVQHILMAVQGADPGADAHCKNRTPAATSHGTMCNTLLKGVGHTSSGVAHGAVGLQPVALGLPAAPYAAHLVPQPQQCQTQLLLPTAGNAHTVSQGQQQPNSMLTTHVGSQHQQQQSIFLQPLQHQHGLPTHSHYLLPSNANGATMAQAAASPVVQVVASNGAILTTTLSQLPALSQQLALASALAPALASAVTPAMTVTHGVAHAQPHVQQQAQQQHIQQVQQQQLQQQQMQLQQQQMQAHQLLQQQPQVSTLQQTPVQPLFASNYAAAALAGQVALPQLYANINGQLVAIAPQIITQPMMHTAAASNLVQMIPQLSGAVLAQQSSVQSEIQQQQQQHCGARLHQQIQEHQQQPQAEVELLPTLLSEEEHDGGGEEEEEEPEGLHLSLPCSEDSHEDSSPKLEQEELEMSSPPDAESVQENCKSPPLQRNGNGHLVISNSVALASVAAGDTAAILDAAESLLGRGRCRTETASMLTQTDVQKVPSSEGPHTRAGAEADVEILPIITGTDVGGSNFALAESSSQFSNPSSPVTTISHTDANTVDGINLEEIKNFAKAFKLRRLSLGLTQTQVGQALSSSEGPSYSQSAICRFEKLDITPKSAQKIKPVLERWMQEAEEHFQNGSHDLSFLTGGTEPTKKRKQRTSFTPAALEVLNKFFETSTHPSGPEMTSLAEKLNYDREVVRVWFCNKRQALKNTIKKLKTNEST